MLCSSGLSSMKRIRTIVANVFGLLVMLLTCVVLGMYFFGLPGKLFDRDTATILYDREDNLLHAQIAGDGQWRFPESDSIPYKFRASLLAFEDQYFFTHRGVHAPSICRAMYLNLANGSVVSGGSTISMQVVRLSRKNPSRTVLEKLHEMVLALNLERNHTKEEVLNLWASHAPMGGNVVGLEAASWRYYGRSPFDLSWAESATLAVLPNAPSLIFPGKNQELLRQKRDALLEVLSERGLLDGTDLKLALAEPLPGKPKPLPQRCPHLASRIDKDNYFDESFHTTIDPMLQQQCERILEHHHLRLAESEIHNGAVLVIDARKGEVLAYVGNTKGNPLEDHGNEVDIIRSPRSTGSILKPFLYASMLNEGFLLADQLVPDVPMSLSGYAPKNYTRQYDGAVPASRALSRSLNVPSVIMLQQHGVAPFLSDLFNLGFRNFRYPAEHYGLSLILGGGEASLYEVCSAYAGMSRSLTYYTAHGNYPQQAFEGAKVLRSDQDWTGGEERLFDAGSIYHTFDALSRVNRPENEAGWQYFSSSSNVSWKTGTSFGFRDAWAVGTTPDIVVGVWIGNADGEGRPGVTGIQAAAPVLFEVMDLFGMQPSFEAPRSAMKTASVCSESGHRAGRYCPNVRTAYVSPKGQQAKQCPHHRQLFLHKTSALQADSRCFPVDELESKSWFVLPPAQEWYFRRNHPEYKSMPAFHPSCPQSEEDLPIDLLYPRSDASISIPTDITGRREKVILKAAHREPTGLLHWHLDQTYLGSTREVHLMEVDPSAGEHRLTLVDESGNMLARTLTFLETE